MDFSLNLPINSVSFGQVSLAILREVFARGLQPSLFPIGNPDTSAHRIDSEFGQWLNNGLAKANSTHKRSFPIIKLWHINGGLESYSDKQILFTFYELDSPTKEEVNILKNNYKVVLSSQHSCDTFEDYGAKNLHKIPLGFDKTHFFRKDKEFFKDGRIVFNVVGKLEKRKNHAQMIRAWIKRFGNDMRYSLQCSIYNPFLRREQNGQIVDDNHRLFVEIINGQCPNNVDFLGYMPHNDMYNDYLNSGDIVLGMSGAEGFGLPEFHSVALGKEAVILDATGYKEWANTENSVLVSPNGKVEAYDGVFFHKGTHFNQGNIFSFNDDEFIAGCEEAIKRAEINKGVNSAGLKLQSDFSYSKTTDSLLKLLE